MFKGNNWTGEYSDGSDKIKIAFDGESKELLIVFFEKTDEVPPCLVR